MQGSQGGMAQQPAAQCPCHPAWASAWTMSGAGFPFWMLCPSVGSWSAPWTAQGLYALPSASSGVVPYSCRSRWAPSLRGKSPLEALPSWTEPFRPLPQIYILLPKPPDLGLFTQHFSLKLFLTMWPCPVPCQLCLPRASFTKGCSSATLWMFFILCYLLA